MFNARGRMDNDQCGSTLKNLESVNTCNYVLKNYHLGNCDMKKTIQFATSQPNVFYNGTHQIGMTGCNVEQNSDLLIGSTQTKPKCRISLLERPFKTVPFLGRGPNNPELESQMFLGNQESNRKTVNLNSEKSYIPYRHYPLIEPIRQSVTNPQYLIESDASETWVRGGESSREKSKKKSHASEHNKYQYY